MKKSTLFLSSSLIIFFIIILVISPTLCIQSCFEGINVWATTLLPALFPFFIFTKLLSELHVIENISKIFAPITKKLYHTDGISAYIYLMSILSGYPVGAKLTVDLYNNGIIDYGQAHRIVSYTSTSGPLFILGTVAIGMFNNRKLGYILIISHFFSALINGLLYRNYKINISKINACNKYNNIKLNNNLLENVMLNSIKSILIVGGYVSLFFMIITILNQYNILYPLQYLIKLICPFAKSQTINSVLNGIVELTKGCLDLSKTNISIKNIAPILSGLISFGGISIFLQAVTFLKSMNFNIKFYFLQKLSHCLLSIIICIPLSILFL